MSSHKHHSCECTHSDVKFCKTCKVVHCLDCNFEWGPKVTTWYWPYYNDTGYLNDSTGYLGGGNYANNSAKLNSGQAIPANLNNNPHLDGQTLTITNSSTCEHKG